MTYRMEQSWRWFGPADPVSLSDIKQTGAASVVTALHHVPHGEAWTVEEIKKRQDVLKSAGLRWSVVESITVHESIKTRTGNYRTYIEKYKESLRNVAACGIPVVTYNFMPVNDWTRTALDYPMPDGSKALYFNWVDLAVFDLFILKRKQADQSYSAGIIEKALHRFEQMSEAEKESLAAVVTFGIPGEEKADLDSMRQKLEPYREIDEHALMDNLCAFQQEIAPLAEELGIKLAIHPDDPPFPLFGLPRIVSRLEQIIYFLEKVDIAANGLCFCTGSLGAHPQNDLPAMVTALGDRIHFVHLRNVSKDAEGNFFEADHLGGDNDMYSIVKELYKIQQRRQLSLPFRPDHGHQMLDDLQKVTNPGYSAIGRLRGLAEIRGLEYGIAESE